MAVVTIPVAPGIPGGGPQDPNGKDNEHRVVIHSISDSAEREGRDAKTAGKAAVWDRLPPTELAKTLAPKPQEPGATKQSIDRIEEHQQAPDLKTPDLANLPEMQQTPPALARAEARAAIEATGPDARDRNTDDGVLIKIGLAGAGLAASAASPARRRPNSTSSGKK